MVNRPLSPYLSVYKPQVGSAFSIMERISGIFLLVICSLIITVLGIFYNFFHIYSIYDISFWLIKSEVTNIIFGSFIYFTMVLFNYHLLFSIRSIFWFIEGGQGAYWPLNLKTNYFIAKLVFLIAAVLPIYFWYFL